MLLLLYVFGVKTHVSLYLVHLAQGDTPEHRCFLLLQLSHAVELVFISLNIIVTSPSRVVGVAVEGKGGEGKEVGCKH